MQGPLVSESKTTKVLLFITVTVLLTITATLAKMEENHELLLYSGGFVVDAKKQTVDATLKTVDAGPYVKFDTISRKQDLKVNVTVEYSTLNMTVLHNILLQHVGKNMVELRTQDSKRMEHYTFMIVTLVEAVKLGFALVFYLVTHSNPAAGGTVPFQVKQIVIFAVPAALYLVDNNLFYTVVSLIGPVKYHLFNNIKTIITAALFRVFLKRKLSGNQWMSLLVLMTGILLTQQGEILRKTCQLEEPSIRENLLGGNSTNIAVTASGAATSIHLSSTDATQLHTFAGMFSSFTVFWGFILTCIMAVCSSFANIWAEYIYKRDTRENFYLQNAYLYIWGILLNGGVLLIKGMVYSDDISRFGLFIGFTGWTPFVILSQSVYGFAIAHVLKVLDNIANLFAHGVAFIATVIVAAIWLNFQPSVIFFGGSIIVFSTMFVYQNSKVVDHKKGMHRLDDDDDGMELYSIGSDFDWDPKDNQPDERTEITLSDTEF